MADKRVNFKMVKIDTIPPCCAICLFNEWDETGCCCELDVEENGEGEMVEPFNVCDSFKRIL